MEVDLASGTMHNLYGQESPTRPWEPAPGYRATAAAPDGMLAANADRERAIDVLKAGYAEGRLTKAEHEDRAGRVYAARTYGELAALIADLPTGPLGGPAHHPGAGCLPRQTVQPALNSIAMAALACGIGEFLTLGLTAIPAIVLGHAARRQMRRTGERGGSMALTGLILGWVGIGLIIAIVAGLIAAASAAGHNVDSVAHPISGG